MNDKERSGDGQEKATVVVTARRLPPHDLTAWGRCPLLPARSLRGDMPESGLPIRVYKEHDMWHVDYGEGVIEDHASEEEATSAADAVAETEERTVVVEE